MKVAELVGATRPEPSPSTPQALQRIDFEIPRKVVLFSPFRPRQYVEDLVRLMLSVDAPRGENYLTRDMQVLEEDLVGAGADPEEVARALRSLEAAVRAALWKKVLGDGS